MLADFEKLINYNVFLTQCLVTKCARFSKYVLLHHYYYTMWLYSVFMYIFKRGIPSQEICGILRWLMLKLFYFLCWFRQPYFSFDFSLSRALASRNMFLCAKFFKWPCNSMVLCVFPFIYLFGRRIRAALFQLRLLCLDRFDTIIDS